MSSTETPYKQACAHAQFTSDWFSDRIETWEQHFGALLRNRPHVHALEIGSWEGRSALWLVTSLLTGEHCTLDCVDTWQGSIEHQHDAATAHSTWSRFAHNLGAHLRTGRVRAQHGTSADVLPRLVAEVRSGRRPAYDFVYVDGSHMAADVFTDAALCFLLLQTGGVLVFDDVEWQAYQDERKTPRIAVEAFLRCFAGRYELLFRGWQVAVRKTLPAQQLLDAV